MKACITSLKSSLLRYDNVHIKNSFNFIKKNVLLKKSFSNTSTIEREVIETDVLIVGGGPAGLSTAIKLAQMCKEKSVNLDITIVEKGENIGSHILSGNCFESKALNQLIPNWQEKPNFLNTEVTEDKFKVLISENYSINIPSFLLPKSINNHGNRIISLSSLCSFLGKEAEELGVNIFTGFSAKEILYESNYVNGVVLNDFGISKDGKQKDSFQAGSIIKSKQTIFAEGCRGNLSEQIISKYNLRVNNVPQHYGLGLKEVWEIDVEKNKNFKPGLVQHTTYWPSDTKTYAGSFMYHQSPNLIHVGYVVGLDYKNPYINPYEEFQTFKTHKDIKKYFDHGTCISYGARTLNEGGFYSLPKLTFPGGMLVGCSAGMLNVAKIKGAHNAIKSGILSAESIFESLFNKSSSTTTESNLIEKEKENLIGKELTLYQDKFNKSEIFKELYESRNFQGGFKYGLFFGMLHGFIINLLKGKEFWKFVSYKKDSEKTMEKSNFQPKIYAKKDGKLTFDILENLSRSGTNHEHDQPSHLVIKKDKISSPIKSLEKFGAPEERFCPAKVYEFVDDGNNGKKLQINAQNCLHCKCCSIKMIDEYIDWTVPEGSGGPKYTIM